MFDLTSSKLLIVAIVALIVVGPKDLPILLRTLGKYLGIIRRHANEFKAQVDEAIREAELDELRKTAESMSREVESSIEDTSRAMDRRIDFEPSRPAVPSAPQLPEPDDAAQIPPPPDRREGSAS